MIRNYEDWKEFVKEKEYKCKYCNNIMIAEHVPFFDEDVYNSGEADIVMKYGLVCKNCDKHFIPRSFAEKEFERRGL